MKVKEIDRTANIAWSPAAHHPIYLAAGTAAQQLDATFSTTAALEIYALNLTEPGLDMCMKGSAVSDFRFHKVVWGCEGMKTSDVSSGVIVGGADGGNIIIYDAAKLIKGESAAIHQNSKHTGPVHSLDFNKFQEYLLASGAGESEIFIWDLNNPTSPVTLGAKSQPPEDVTCVSWNCQVQHILASTFHARCIVWDLRKNEPIIKVSDSSSRFRCKVVAWHPEVATQLCLASEDDHCPVIQLWDLRFATSPLKTLENHQRGILSIAWCPQDPDLLLSCGKDNRILCWNPNSSLDYGEVLCELPAGNQWSFDVAWCPRNPAIIANSSCDGHVGVFSLMGGQQQVQCSSKIAESFPGSDKLIQPPNVESIHRHISVPLQKPPKWVRKPVGASFGFGGKLVYFGNEVDNQSQADSVTRKVHISQVVTEPELLSKAEKLESSLANGNLVEFCQSKIDSTSDEQERILWNFLLATFSNSPRSKMLTLLGYNYEKIGAEINKIVRSQNGSILEAADIDAQMASLSTSGDGSQAFDSIAMNEREREEPVSILTDLAETDGLISQAILTGNISSAIEVCIKDGRWADALVLSQAGGMQLLQKTQKLYFKSVNTPSSKLISAVVTSDWASLVRSCEISCWKEMLAAILTYAKPEDFPVLCELLGQRLQKDPQLQHYASLCYISAGNLECLAQAWSKKHEKQDVNSLQNLIEQVMILRRSVEQLSGTTLPLQTGTLSSLLGQYAELLAAQGKLNSASTYLLDPNERTLSILQDRIYQALGHRSPFFPFKPMSVRRSSSVSSTTQQQQYTAPQQQQYMTPQQQQYTAPQQQQYSAPSMQPSKESSYLYQSQQQQFSYGSLASSVPNTFTYSNTAPHPHPLSSMNPVPPSPSPAVPSPAVPPPPDSSQQTKSSMGHLSHRYPRHLHDPSVYSENTYTSQPCHAPQTFSPPQPPPAEMIPPAQSVGNFYSPPDMNANVRQSQPLAPTSVSSYASTPYTSYMPSMPVSSLNSTPAPLPSCYSDVKPGWNDPPLLKQSSMKPQNPNYESPTPITSPFPDAPAPVQPPVPPGAPGFFVPSFPGQQQPSTVPANNMQSQMPPMPDQPKINQNIVEAPKEKGPIPPEHQVLQDIFEDLRRQCQQVATNPQTRRKLDDVAKKLENLYDKLRDNSLSNTVTHGLHQVVQGIMQSNYSSALAVHGQLVQNATFSEVSGFMPSIKVLLQTAAQLNVFLQ